MCIVKMGLILEELSNDLHSIKLPSTLWAVHLDPRYEFIAVSCITFHFNKLTNEKAVLLTVDDNVIKLTVYLNDELVKIPKVREELNNVRELERLLYDLEGVKYCINSDNGTNCGRYIWGSGESFCESCAFEGNLPMKQSIFSCFGTVAVEEPQKYLENLSPFNDVFLPTPKSNVQDVDVDKDKEKKCLCTVCGRTFTSNSAMQHHMLTHSEEKPFGCKICAKSFAKKYNLEVHLRIHSGERPYVCSKCGKTYSSRSNLTTHLNSFHREIKQHQCEFCQMTFVHPRLLKIHMRKHTGEKPYRCVLCPKSFAKNIHLTIHMRTHTGEKPHRCPNCPKAFTTTGNLNSHLRTNHKNSS